MFPWSRWPFPVSVAKGQQTQGAVKLRVGLDADNYLPVFVDLTEDQENRQGNLAETFRLITSRDEETKIICQFVTNALEVPV